VAAHIDAPADPTDSSPSPVDFDPIASPGDLEAADDADVPEHSMCEDLLGSCADNHLVCQVSVDERGGP
jgi:hypothetical protein